MTIQEIISLTNENIYDLNSEETLVLCKKIYKAQVELDDYIEANANEEDYLIELSNILDNNLGYLLTH